MNVYNTGDKIAMSKKKIKLEDIESVNPFKVPEGYFDNFTENMMSRLPDRIVVETKPISLWMRVKPWVYMAAMFAGIALMLRVFIGSPELISKSSNTLNLSSSAEIDEFYEYYEDQFVKTSYNEAIYLTMENFDWSED